MRTVKKLVSFVLAGAMAFGMSVSVFATSGISDSEQKILDEAKTKAVELGVDVKNSKMYKEYISQASTYLAKNALNQTQVDAMVKAIDDATATAKAKMQDKNVSSLAKLSTEDFNKLFDQVGNQITESAKAVGISVKKTSEGYEVEALAPDADKTIDKADVYVQTNSVIKQTGPELLEDQNEMLEVQMDTATAVKPIVLWCVMLAGAVVACGIVVKKKKLFSDSEV